MGGGGEQFSTVVSPGSVSNTIKGEHNLKRYCALKYEGCSFNVVIGVLQGALLIPFTFRLLQPFEVFSLDGNTLFKSRNPFCKGRKVGLFRYTLDTGKLHYQVHFGIHNDDQKGFSLVKET